MFDTEGIEVHAIGSTVLLDGTVPARVTAVFIRDNGRVTYEVVWWNDRKREEEVVEPWEIQPDNDKTRGLRVSQIL